MLGSAFFRDTLPQRTVSLTDESGRLIMRGRADSITIDEGLFTVMPEVTVSFRDMMSAVGTSPSIAPVVTPCVRSTAQIRKVIYNDPATIVLWDDGTKTVVKCHDGDTYSKQVGLLMCIAKKLYGNRGRWYDVLRESGALDD